MQPVTTAADIGPILATRRKHLKLSQAQVAARVGLSQNRLSVLESHPETLTAKQLLALLDVLGLALAIDAASPNYRAPA
jgi:HTH-type transcriptional regulator/antitoxin HipB